MHITHACSHEDVISIVSNKEIATDWSTLTNSNTIEKINQLTKTYGQLWNYASISKEDVLSVCVPEHIHNFQATLQPVPVFVNNTFISEAVDILHNNPERYESNCREHIEHIRASILAHGYTTIIILVFTQEKLEHIDGLHRLIALGSLIKKNLIKETTFTAIIGYIQ